MEFLPDRESKVSGILMCLDGLIYVVSPSIFQNVTNDLNWFLIAASVMNVTSLVLFMVIKVPESLKYLLS